jgi:AcrR family transcriptional regulator
MAQADSHRSAPRSDALATRARIVAAAERLFAQRGIDAVSLVEIGKAAGQRNRSAVQYHFGDKRGVIHAILDKHTPGIETRRHAMLDQLEASGVLELRRLVEVLVLPAAEKLDDPDGGPEFLLINAELVGHPRYPLLDLDAERVNRAGQRLRRLTSVAAPPLPDSLWVPRWLLVTGLLFHGLADWIRVGETLSRRRAAPTRDDFVGPIIAAIQAVMEAPSRKELP